MKNLILTALILILSVPLFAQWTDQGTYLSTTDKVAIGSTTPPVAPLEITGSGNSSEVLNIKNNFSSNFRIYSYGNQGYYNSSFQVIRSRGTITNPTNVLSGDRIGGLYGRMYQNDDYRASVGIEFYSGNVSSSSYGGYIIFGTTADGQTTRQERMRITQQGSVGIGTATTGSHKLAVEGSIGAREVVVESGAWSDFVFDEDYHLPSLEEVEGYIADNHHLPEIPSEAEVLEEGINLGEMDAKLLQKIEELTLYLIEQNKQNKVQQEKIAELEKKIAAMVGK